MSESPAETSAREQITALMFRLMAQDGIAPHVIASALIANLTLNICSGAPSVADANRAMNAAAEAIKANKRFVPLLVAKARATVHAAELVAAAGGDRAQ